MSKRRVLIIEDDLDFCEVLTESLEDENFSVNFKLNGAVGKEELLSQKYDFLILDIKIPGMNGFEILSWLQQNPLDLKIIVLTGMPINDKISHLLNKDLSKEHRLLEYADVVLNKPVKTEILLQKLKEIS